jgi:hypothetical protein
MPMYVKTIVFGPVNGGLKVTHDQVDPIINETLEKIQHAGGKILDVKVALTQLTLGNYVSTYLVTYNAAQPYS